MTLPLDEYFRTTFDDKMLVKMPEKEEDHLTTATRLLEKRREMQEIDQALTAQKEEFQMKMESLQQRREELERKEYQLKESLLKLDKNLKENDAKKNRELKKTLEEQTYKRQKIVEMDRLKQDINKFTEFRERLKLKLEQYVVFQHYLERVIEVSEEFNEIREIIDRYETLTSTYDYLVANEDGNQHTIEDKKRNLTDERDQKNSAILKYNNQIGELQSKLDKLQSCTLEKEMEWNVLRTTAAEKTLTCGRIRLATYNLFQILKKYPKHQPSMTAVQQENTDLQLTHIQSFIQDLIYVISEVNSHSSSTTVSGITAGMDGASELAVPGQHAMQHGDIEL